MILLVMLRSVAYTLSMMNERLERYEDDYELVGFRFVEEKPEVGSTLNNSLIWDGDTPTEDELNGTSAFSKWEDMENYAKYSKGKGFMLIIGGENRGSWNDIPGEVLIGDAEVLEVVEW